MSAAAPAPPELRLFGPPRLLREGSSVHVGSRKAVTLLALLALDGSHSRERLATLLWPDVDAAAARRNLRREVFRLRTLGCPLRDDSDATDGTLTLDTALAVDVLRFGDALQRGDDATALQAAGASVFDGLDGVAGAELDAWLARWRAQLLQQRHAASLRHAQDLEQHGEPASALALLLRVLAEDPCAESAARQAMRLHAALGDRAAALALFTRLTAALDDELALQPDAQTQALAAQLRGADIALVAATAAPPEPAAVRGERPAGLLLADRLPFVGRAAVRAQIAAAWAAGKRVYLSGVPGAGKTRLATECAAAQGAWLRVACAQDDAEQPYASAIRALRALQEAAPDVVLPDWVRRELAVLLPELGPAVVPLASPEAAERLRAAFAAAWRLLVRDNFSVLLLDDWQWGDAASVELWNRLDDAEAPVRWIVAHRSAQLPPAALQRMRQDVDGGHAVAIALEGLAADEALALVRALSGSPGGHLFALRLQRATEGNPFFLIETLRHLVEQGQLQVGPDGTWSTPFDDLTHDYAELPVPASVRDAVLGRVRALGEPARRLLEAASLAGDSFTLQVLDGLAPLPPAQAVAVFEHAQAARLLLPAGAGYRFAHDLVRQCLADSLSPARRRLLHGALALRLAACGAAPALVALQHERAGQATDAVVWRQRAAEAAWRVHALADAQLQYERALADGASGAQAVALHLALARLHRRQADGAGVTAALAAALLAAQDADANTRLEAQLACADDRCHSDRTDEGLALLDALAGDLAAAPPMLRARAITLRATVLQWRGQDDAAAALRREAIALLDGVPGALVEQADVLDAAARAAMRLGDMAEVETLARRAIAGYEAAADDTALSTTLTLLGVCLLYGRNDRAAAGATFDRARALAARCGHVPAQRAAILNLVKLHTDAGDADAALALLAEGEALAPGFEHQRAEQAFLQARYFVHYLRGDVADAGLAAQRLLALARRVADLSILLASLQMVVDLYLHTGRLAAAGALLDEAEHVLAQGDANARSFLQGVVTAKRAWWLLAGGDAGAAVLQLAAVPAQPRVEDRLTVGWIGAAAALAVGDSAAARVWLDGLDIDADAPTDAQAMVLVQRLALAQATGSADAAAAARAHALLQRGQVPALEAALLRARLG